METQEKFLSNQLNYIVADHSAKATAFATNVDCHLTAMRRFAMCPSIIRDSLSRTLVDCVPVWLWMIFTIFYRLFLLSNCRFILFPRLLLSSEKLLFFCVLIWNFLFRCCLLLVDVEVWCQSRRDDLNNSVCRFELQWDEGEKSMMSMVDWFQFNDWTELNCLNCNRNSWNSTNSNWIHSYFLAELLTMKCSVLLCDSLKPATTTCRVHVSDIFTTKSRSSLHFDDSQNCSARSRF